MIVTVGQKTLGALHFSIGGPYLGRALHIYFGVYNLVIRRQRCVDRVLESHWAVLPNTYLNHAWNYLLAVSKAISDVGGDSSAEKSEDERLAWTYAGMKQLMDEHEAFVSSSRIVMGTDALSDSNKKLFMLHSTPLAKKVHVASVEPGYH